MRPDIEHISDEELQALSSLTRGISPTKTHRKRSEL